MLRLQQTRWLWPGRPPGVRPRRCGNAVSRRPRRRSSPPMRFGLGAWRSPRPNLKAFLVLCTCGHPMRASLLDSTIGRIRPATLQDLPVIAALHCECFADGWDVDFLGRLWAQRGAIGAIAFEKGAPAGFLLARVNAGEAEILSLGVRLPSRRRSLGTALVKNVLER